jgi:hypothetical protein
MPAFTWQGNTHEDNNLLKNRHSGKKAEAHFFKISGGTPAPSGPSTTVNQRTVLICCNALGILKLKKLKELAS